jgi:hypothetical protein
LEFFKEFVAKKTHTHTLAPSIPPEMHLLEKRRVKVGKNWTLLFHKY